MSPRRLPNYLRTHRKRAHLTQEEVAFILGGESGARISRHERRRQNPNLRTLLAYEILFRTPIRELYGGVAADVEKGLAKRARLLLQKLAKAGKRYLAARKIDSLLARLKPKTSRNSDP
jgi:transcriptional regulator with XRE-family HTH domain